METYLRTALETRLAAEKAKEKNFNTHLVKSGFMCECGESMAYYLIDSSTLNTLEIFVYCEACTNNYN